MNWVVRLATLFYSRSFFIRLYSSSVISPLAYRLFKISRGDWCELTSFSDCPLERNHLTVKMIPAMANPQNRSMKIQPPAPIIGTPSIIPLPCIMVSSFLPVTALILYTEGTSMSLTGAITKYEIIYYRRVKIPAKLRIQVLVSIPGYHSSTILKILIGSRSE